MEKRDEIRCWACLIMTPEGLDTDVEIGCCLCTEVRSKIYIHTTNPEYCDCRQVHWESGWYGYHGYASTMWPTCEECLKRYFDIIFVDENKSGIMTYRFCNSYPTILGKKLKDVRNTKRAYQ